MLLDAKFHPIPTTQLKSFIIVFTGYLDGLVRSSPGGIVNMLPRYGENADKIYRIQPRKDDVWLLTFPKAGILCKTEFLYNLNIIIKRFFGTTWVSEMVWLIMHIVILIQL